MSEPTDKDVEQFWDLVEEVINLANSKTETLDPGVVTSALMQATARFNAFYVASSCESRKDFKEDKDDALSRFTGDYKRRLAENLEDYIENYKIYMADDQGVQE
ncbi:DUF3144 domain-containing protein [Teredinibacter sp. KSP-S5-2]|uniref:DUF3144 domain-containing protein n=1 Tax=Teredinibacter sp. KSP-S5-2 TaxID=3034506 RepID=UPI0029342BA4|nr:DUF3144 domain-containing protein [Teredinibacter sp. KSP-S5-2]WNO09549.1 DUF3144 domain-containing protein [Teredinibacter sp. KSP-S5-2]